MTYLEVHGLEKSYATPSGSCQVLGGLDLSLDQGEFVAIVGYSGSGKTTLMSLIAGLIAADRGSITLDGAPVAGPGPDLGIVPQQYSLLPWMTVFDNIALAVDAVNPDLARADRARLTEEFIALVNLTPARWKRPRELSGGMRQRVAVARGLATQPKVLLMDEPFSALDALTRERFDLELLRLWQRAATTIVIVTHSIPEAVLIADRVIVLSARPARIVADIAIDLPRPRTIAALDDPAAGRASHRVRAFLEDDEGNAAGALATAVPVATELAS
jgi:nitrate/nitrite transport system ATP-binding protein